MAERVPMPLFVPRTVAAFERAATAVARRVATPSRTLAARALSFADRVLGSWVGTGTTAGGGSTGGERSPMRLAERGGGLVVARPWYEVETDEEQIGPTRRAPAAATVAAATVAAATMAAATVAAATPARPPAPAAAQRGATIPRTALTAPPEQQQQAVGRTVDPQTPHVESGEAVAPPAATTSAPRETLAEPEVRAAEALGLRQSAPAVESAPTATRSPVAAATLARLVTPFARALGHAAWVDQQLRGVRAPVESSPRSSGSYVFVAPPSESGRPTVEMARTIIAEPPTTTVPGPLTVAPLTVAPLAVASPTMAPPTVASPAVASPTVAPTMATIVTAPAPAMLRAPAVPQPALSTAAWSAALPDPTLAPAAPTTIARRVADFVARLVGVRTARDAAPLLAIDAAPTVVSTQPLEARAPARTLLTLPDATDPSIRSIRSTRSTPPAIAASATVASWRPGATAARVEQLGTRIDTRATATWGEPVVVAAPRASVERAWVAPAVNELQRPATGPARTSRFMDALVGVQAVRATAPLPLPLPLPVETVTTTSLRTPKSAYVPGSPAVRAASTTSVLATTGAPLATSARAPGRVPLVPAMLTTARPEVAPGRIPSAPALAPGGIGRLAEQLGGAVGVRAAGLSIEFVDPARLATLPGAAPAMTTVAPAPEAVPMPMPIPTKDASRETVMPSPQPLFAYQAAPAPALSAEEWSLVATFPSSTTAVQLIAARQAAQWQEVATHSRAAAAPARTLLTAPSTVGRAAGSATATMTSMATSTLPGPGQVAAILPVAARGGVPAEYVLATVAEAASSTAGPARLPSGRAPRGSYTWPKTASIAPAAAEWTAPVAATSAEYAKQAAPGMPLWGVMPHVATHGVSLDGPLAVASEGAAATSGAFAASAPPAARTDTRTDTRTDAPAMTLMTAAATREARAAARAGTTTVRDGSEADVGGTPTMTMSSGAPEPGRATTSKVRAGQTMPLMASASPSSRDGGAATSGPAARALELARPFLRLAESGGGSQSPRSSTPRFFEQPQPLVSGAPSNDSTARMMDALRSQPAATPGDDRVSLADLTLIAIASATQQVAASPAGGGPAAAAPAATPASSASSGAGGAGGSPGNPTQDIEELARAAFDELQRLIAMARERSGDHG